MMKCDHPGCRDEAEFVAMYNVQVRRVYLRYPLGVVYCGRHLKSRGDFARAMPAFCRKRSVPEDGELKWLTIAAAQRAGIVRDGQVIR